MRPASAVQSKKQRSGRGLLSVWKRNEPEYARQRPTLAGDGDRELAVATAAAAAQPAPGRDRRPGRRGRGRGLPLAGEARAPQAAPPLEAAWPRPITLNDIALFCAGSAEQPGIYAFDANQRPRLIYRLPKTQVGAAGVCD